MVILENLTVEQLTLTTQGPNPQTKQYHGDGFGTNSKPELQ